MFGRIHRTQYGHSQGRIKGAMGAIAPGPP